MEIVIGSTIAALGLFVALIAWLFPRDPNKPRLSRQQKKELKEYNEKYNRYAREIVRGAMRQDEKANTEMLELFGE